MVAKPISFSILTMLLHACKKSTQKCRDPVHPTTIRLRETHQPSTIVHENDGIASLHKHIASTVVLAPAQQIMAPNTDRNDAASSAASNDGDKHRKEPALTGQKYVTKVTSVRSTDAETISSGGALRRGASRSGMGVTAHGFEREICTGNRCVFVATLDTPLSLSNAFFKYVCVYFGALGGTYYQCNSTT